MKILSLFDGISCARVALKKAGIPVEVYYASEIDKFAMQVSKNNWHEIIQVGSVTDIHIINGQIATQNFRQGSRMKGIDLMIGGSPCQDLSIAGKRKGLAGEKSGLFYEYVRILKEVKPKYFILKNVNSMPKDARETITKELFDIEPVMINASLVSAQNRKRLFWVGKLNKKGGYNKVEIPQPKDKGILLDNILESGNAFTDKAYALTCGGEEGLTEQGFSHYKKFKKDNFVQDSRLNSNKTIRIKDSMEVRKLTSVEYERLQGLPDDYTDGIPKTQRRKVTGNAFNASVVAHILKFIK